VETAINWNQMPFRVQAEINIGLYSVENTQPYFARLTERLQAIIDSSEQWRDSAENGNDWHVCRPEVRGFGAHFKLLVPFSEIKPSQLRALCSYVNRLAERLAEENDPNIDTVYAEVAFRPCSTIFTSGSSL